MNMEYSLEYLTNSSITSSAVYDRPLASNSRSIFINRFPAYGILDFDDGINYGRRKSLTDSHTFRISRPIFSDISTPSTAWMSGILPLRIWMSGILPLIR